MPLKILVVDDETDLELMMRQQFRKQIRSGDFQFFFAHNGADALSVLEQDKEIEIMLTDINMPVMNGLALLGNIQERSINPLMKSIIISAYGDIDKIRSAMNRGAFDFLTKPIDFNDLEITIQKTISQIDIQKQATQAREQLVSLFNELNIARTIQQSILPQVFPAFPERRDFDIYAGMLTAKEVGGDFYDFFLIDADRWGFVIGDVSGKGVPASIFMAVSKTLLKATALSGLAPGECITRVNKVLARESDAAMFVTLFYGILDLRSGEVVYCNGGHNPPVVMRKSGEPEWVPSTGGLLVGALDVFTYDDKTIQLSPGDSLYLYTDGVTEAENNTGSMYGESRLLECLSRLESVPPVDVITAVVSDVQAFTIGAVQSDDITSLALLYRGGDHAPSITTSGM